MPNIPRLVAAGVLTVAIASMLVMWVLFVEMWIHGETSITLVFNRYGEFWTEFALYMLATICLPVLVYEIDAYIRD